MLGLLTAAIMLGVYLIKYSRAISRYKKHGQVSAFIEAVGHHAAYWKVLGLVGLIGGSIVLFCMMIALLTRF